MHAMLDRSADPSQDTADTVPVGMSREAFIPDDGTFDAMIAANYGDDGTGARMTRELFGPNDPNGGIYATREGHHVPNGIELQFGSEIRATRETFHSDDDRDAAFRKLVDDIEYHFDGEITDDRTWDMTCVDGRPANIYGSGRTTQFTATGGGTLCRDSRLVGV